jgi:hypothetical protein
LRDPNQAKEQPAFHSIVDSHNEHLPELSILQNMNKANFRGLFTWRRKPDNKPRFWEKPGEYQKQTKKVANCRL